MSNLNQRIETLEKHQNCLGWLCENLLVVEQTLMQALNTDRHAIRTITLTLNIYDTIATVPYLFDPDNWIRLLYEALLIAQQMRDNYTQVLVWIRMGTIYAQNGRVTSARTAFTIALERAEQEHKYELVLRLYIHLFALHTQDQVGDVPQAQVDDACDLANRLENHKLTAALKQQVATAYGFRGEVHQAELYAQEAMTYWRLEGNPVEMARTVFSLSASHRIVDNIEVALELLNGASDLFATTDYPRQHLAINFEYAQHLLHQKNYDDAYELLKLTQRELSQMNAMHTTARDHAACSFSMAELFRHNAQFDQAREAYQSAISHWRNCADTYYQAMTLHELSCLELEDNQPQKAAALLQNSFDFVKQLPQSPRKERLNASLAETQSQL